MPKYSYILSIVEDDVDIPSLCKKKNLEIKQWKDIFLHECDDHDRSRFHTVQISSDKPVPKSPNCDKLSCDSSYCCDSFVTEEFYLKYLHILPLDCAYAEVFTKIFVSSPRFVENAMRNLKKKTFSCLSYYTVKDVAVLYNLQLYSRQCQEVKESGDATYEMCYGRVHYGKESIMVCLQPCAEPALDMKWSSRLIAQIKKRMLLDDAMNWLSTLGGGYSSLGEHNVSHALEAGRISMKQLRVAMEMGDPPTVIRCHLYMALSYMQQSQLKKAKHVIRFQHSLAKRTAAGDYRLHNMIIGLWNRLQYQWQLIKKPNRHTNRHTNGYHAIVR